MASEISLDQTQQITPEIRELINELILPKVSSSTIQKKPRALASQLIGSSLPRKHWKKRNSSAISAKECFETPTATRKETSSGKCAELKIKWLTFPFLLIF